MIVQQILLIGGALGNVYRTVWRVGILMQDSKI